MFCFRAGYQILLLFIDYPRRCFSAGLQRTSAGSLPDHAGNLGAAELLRLQEEVLSSRSTLAAWEESMLQARKVHGLALIERNEL